MCVVLVLVLVLVPVLVLGLLLPRGYGYRAGLWFQDLVGDQVFWVGLDKVEG